MNFLSNFAEEVTKAIDFIVEKNRKAALINRIKLVIKNEEQNAEKAYIALGKYYYRNLRNAENEETESHCCVIDNANQKIDKAITRLEELTREEQTEKNGAGCADCASDCDDCPYFEDYDHQVSMEDLKAEDAAEDEEEPQEPNVVLHPELVWQDDEPESSEEKTENKEAADHGDGSAIPSDY